MTSFSIKATYLVQRLRRNKQTKKQKKKEEGGGKGKKSRWNSKSKLETKDEAINYMICFVFFACTNATIFVSEPGHSGQSCHVSGQWLKGWGGMMGGEGWVRGRLEGMQELADVKEMWEEKMPGHQEWHGTQMDREETRRGGRVGGTVTAKRFSTFKRDPGLIFLPGSRSAASSWTSDLLSARLYCSFYAFGLNLWTSVSCMAKGSLKDLRQICCYHLQNGSGPFKITTLLINVWAVLVIFKDTVYLCLKCLNASINNEREDGAAPFGTPSATAWETASDASSSSSAMGS